jgi:hypothetical protein
MSLNWGQYIFIRHGSVQMGTGVRIKYILSPIKAAKAERAL